MRMTSKYLRFDVSEPGVHRFRLKTPPWHRWALSKYVACFQLIATLGAFCSPAQERGHVRQTDVDRDLARPVAADEGATSRAAQNALAFVAGLERKAGHCTIRRLIALPFRVVQFR